jgi:hypothetical protein
MGALLAFPLLLVALGVYNIIAFTAPASLGVTAVELAMLSGAVLELSWGDAVILSGLMLLAVEVAKAIRAGTGAIVRHVVSLLVFLAALAEMLLLEQAATATFFTLLAICLIDVIAGLAVAFRPGPQGLSMRAGS